MNTPRRYTRTMQEAFGPYTSRHIHVEPPRSSLRAWAAYLAILAIALACAVLTGCSDAKADGEHTWPKSEVRKTTPDEHGVVCYQYVHGYTISCVKVK
jgi:hypothetical protein